VAEVDVLDDAGLLELHERPVDGRLVDAGEQRPHLFRGQSGIGGEEHLHHASLGSGEPAAGRVQPSMGFLPVDGAGTAIATATMDGRRGHRDANRDAIRGGVTPAP
jgi:hypothetical protein